MSPDSPPNGEETLIETLRDVLLGLGKSDLRKICVQNWHYENAGILWEACDLAVETNRELKVLLVEDPFPSFTDAELAALYPDGFPGWTRILPQSGVLWHPSVASSDLGERFIAATARRLAEAIRTELS